MKKNKKLGYVILTETEDKIIPIAVIVAESMAKAAEMLGAKLGEPDHQRWAYTLHTPWKLTFSFDNLMTDPMWERTQGWIGNSKRYWFTFKKGQRDFGECFGRLAFTIVFNEEKRQMKKYWIQLVTLLN